MTTLYDALEFCPNASLEELRWAFKRRALAVHPDKGGTNHAFQELLAAFEVLADPVQRSAYDKLLAKRANHSLIGSRKRGVPSSVSASLSGRSTA